jgi:Zn-dependent peptidase ImmA (M78 family)
MQSSNCYRRHYLKWERAHGQLLADLKADWEVPSQAVIPLIKTLGYQIRRAHLSRDRWAEVSFERRTVLVAGDLRGRMDHPESGPRVLVSSLAHELAHIVLHEDKPPRFNHEVEAWVWATMFLAPWWLLRKSSDVRALSSGILTDRQRWARIYGIAKYLQVSPSLVQQALRLYGIGESTALGPVGCIESA